MSKKNTETTTTTQTPLQAAMAAAEAKPGRSVAYEKSFLLKNKSVGVLFRMDYDAKGKKWNVTDTGTGKVIFSKDAETWENMRRVTKKIIKKWTKTTVGTDPAAKAVTAKPAAKPPAAPSSPAKTPAKGKAAKTGDGEDKPPAPGRSKDNIFAGDNIKYRPAAAKNSYPGRVVKVGPNKVQVSVQMAPGQRPKTLWAPRPEVTVQPKAAPVTA